MTDHPIRFFADDAAIARIGAGLLNRTLPRADWTHEAHLAACVWLIRERPDIDLDARIADIISGYNAAAGGVNDDRNGYHDTITRVYLVAARAHLAARPADEPLFASVNALLASDAGSRDFALRFYSRDRLMSVEARRGFVEPDLATISSPATSLPPARPSRRRP